ncbi:MAG: hypothetical protein OXE46_12825 [Chloroflexi bacterium]|nr:hypothetical protein [Chloroflexota bacterium]
MKLPSPRHDLKRRIAPAATTSHMALRRLCWLPVIIAVCCILALYLHTARIQSGVNSKLSMSDQSAYMDFAISAYDSQLHYTGGRNRMPLFSWLMALFYLPELSDEAFFAVGKLVNVWLSVLILALLGAAFLRRFSKLYGAYATLCIAFLAFVLKSPFFQAEILFYGLFAAAYICAIDNLRNPGWRRSLAVGLLLGLAHFTKASALPALLIYLASLALCWCGTLLRAERKSNQAGSLPAQALLTVLAFGGLLLPYLHESYQHYGSHFYNVNTTFYVWYDSWSEAKAGTRAAGDRIGYPDLPPDKIPSLQKYLREHSPQQIVDRVLVGSQRLISYGCTREKSFHRYGYCSQVALGLLVFVFAVPLLIRQTAARKPLEHAQIVCFTLAIFAAYALGAAWYMPITGNEGPRVLLVLIVPFYWTLGLATHAEPVQALKLRLWGYRCKLTSLLFGLMSLTLVYEIYQVVAFRAATMYGGK